MGDTTASLADIDLWYLVVFAAKQWLPLIIGMAVWVIVVGWRIMLILAVALSSILRLIQLTLRLSLAIRMERESRLSYVDRLRRMNRDLKKGR